MRLLVLFRQAQCRAKAFLEPPNVRKIMAFIAVIMGLGLLFYILSGFRSSLGFRIVGFRVQVWELRLQGGGT